MRVSNPELQDLVKEFERKNRPPMTPDMARRLIEHEALLLRNRHHEVWRSYIEHKKALNNLLAAEPQKPKLFGIKKWKLEHSKWVKERDGLAGQIVSDLEALSVKPSSDEAEYEAKARHGRYDRLALEEALRQNPDAATIIREDDARIEREKQTSLETEEAKAREEKENNRRFYAAIRELAGKFNKEVSFVTNAQDGMNYSGLMIGTAERNGHYYAAQIMYDGHVILHDIESDDLNKIRPLSGKNVEIRSVNGRIGTIAEEQGRRGRSRGWSR